MFKKRKKNCIGKIFWTLPAENLTEIILQHCDEYIFRCLNASNRNISERPIWMVLLLRCTFRIRQKYPKLRYIHSTNYRLSFILSNIIMELESVLDISIASSQLKQRSSEYHLRRHLLKNITRPRCLCLYVKIFIQNLNDKFILFIHQQILE